jgi:hypothetical protein
VNDNPTGDEKPNGDRYIKDSEDRFFFDGASGIYKPKAYQTETKSRKQAKNSQRFLVTTFISALTLIAVGVYAYFAVLQWREMRSASAAAWESVAEIQRQTRLDERPWIRAITPLAPSPIGFRAGEIIQFHVIVRALGKTPAEGIHGKLTAEIVREGEPVTLTYGPSIEMQSGIMFPTQEVPVSIGVYSAVADKRRDVVAESRPITKAEADLLRSGKAEVVIYGEFTFSDVFGTNHWYQFCVPQSTRQERTLKDWDAKQSCAKYNGTDNNQSFPK